VVAKDKDADSRLSLSIGNLKDMRAYEHDRQRMMKAAELVKRKARKSLAWSTVLQPKIHPSTTGISGKHERLRVEDVDPLDGLEYDADVRRVPHSLPGRLGGVPYKMELKLGDLVTARKPRKGSDGDFEVIPHVRSVIVLDDFIGLDPNVEEPWEYIRGQFEEDGITPALSYAEILSSGK